MQNPELHSPNSPNQPPESEKQRQTPRNIASRARRIDRTTLSEIAQLCAKGLLQGEACRKISVNPKSFLSWKSRNRNNEKWAALLEKFRAIRFDSLITKIDNAADGVNMKQPDWRAAHAALMIGDKARFSPSIYSGDPQTITNITQNNYLFQMAAARIYGQEPTLPPQPARPTLPNTVQDAPSPNVAALLEVLPKDPRTP